MVFFNRTIKKFANKKRVWGLTLKKGDKVYLLKRIPNTKIIFIQTIRLSNKLNFTKLESFKNLKALKPVTYKLDLSNNIKIIKIRYISVLKSANLEIPLMEDILDINPKS